MTITFNVTKVFAGPGDGFNQCGMGCYTQSDGSYLFGWGAVSTSAPYPITSLWYRSVDDGNTWTSTGGAEGPVGPSSAFACNLHANIICAPSYNFTGPAIGVYRSTNNAASWTNVLSIASAATPNGRAPSCYSLAAYNRTKAIAAGQFDGNKNNPAHQTAVSTDSGASWTPQVGPDTSHADNYGESLGVAPNGHLWLGYAKRNGPLFDPHTASSINGGNTWSLNGGLPKPGGGTGGFTTAITALDENNIVICGGGGHSPPASLAWLWWSSDAGTTFNLVPSSDIAGWPSGAFYTYLWEVKRLTRDAVILAIDRQRGTPACPWNLSLDMGHTFPIQAVPTVGNFPNYGIPVGQIVTTRTGALLLPLWESATYATASICIWRGTITC